MREADYCIPVQLLIYLLMFGTEYFWEQLPGNIGFFISLVLVLWLFALVIYIPILLIRWSKRRYKSNGVPLNAAFILVVALAYLFMPNTIYHVLDKDYKDSVLLAYSQGCFSGQYSLQLNTDKTFLLRSNNLREIDRELGTYAVTNDTIYLNYLPRYKKRVNPRVATIEPEYCTNSAGLGYVNIYTPSGLDAGSISLGIAKNELP